MTDRLPCADPPGARRGPGFTGLLLLGLLLLPGLIPAHPTGTALVDVKLAEDSLRIVADINSDDILNAAWPTGSVYGLPDSTYPEVHERIGYYLKNNIFVKVDGERVDPIRVCSWYPGGGPQDLMDSARLSETTYIIAMAAPFKPREAMLTVQSSMWAHFGIEPITQVSVFWRDTLIHREWIRLEDRVRLSVHPDSLEAALERGRSAGGKGGPGFGEILGRFVFLGFIHIVPEGLDHILFVLGLFFFSTLFRPLLIQVTAFTVAHSITLALAVLGIFSLPGRVVEPLIALSIAVVGIENVFFRRESSWRWLLVFAFGLIHGLGFAGVLKELGLSQGNFLATLLGFNLGVELGQVAVIGAAAAATFWAWKKRWYFRYMVVPCSLLIAAVGLYWAVERLLGG